MITQYKIETINTKALEFLSQADYEEFHFLYNGLEKVLSHSYHIHSHIEMICEDEGITFEFLSEDEQNTLYQSTELFYKMCKAFGLDNAQKMVTNMQYRYFE